VGKVIVITGAGVGLGRALARRFAKDGDTTILLGRTFSKVKALADELGEPHLAIECDVGLPDSVQAAFASIAEHHGKIDVLINNAALYEPFKLRDATDEQILTTAQANYLGPIYMCRSALTMMEKGAQIINISTESVDDDFAMLSLYQSSKAGMERFSKSLMDEVEADGIRVCVVRAGPMLDENKEMMNWAPEVGLKFFEENMAIGRNLAENPITNVDSVPGLFRMLIDLPPDFRIRHVIAGSRHP